MNSTATPVVEAAESFQDASHTHTVPSGYKQTDVGVIPTDWDVLTLAELCRRIIDGTHFTPRYVAEGIPFYSVENVTADEFVDVKYISQDEHENLLQRCKPERGDILMTRIGTLGKTKLIDWDVDASIYVSLALLKLGEGIESGYLYRYTHSLRFLQDVERRSLVNASPQKINMNAIGGIQIPVPSKRREQRAIARALSDVDDLARSIEAVIAKKRAMKMAAMQNLLTGRIRLPGFSGAWESKRLGEIAVIRTGSRNNEDKDQNGRYPFFVRSDVVERINSYSYDCEAILVPGEGRIGSIFHYITGRFDVHQRVYAITQFIPVVSGRFIYFYMVLKYGDWALKNTVRATVDSLRLPTFQSFELKMPSTVDEQSAIASVLSDMDAEIAALERRRDKTNNIKRGMMQELLTGRIRLIEPHSKGATA